MFFYGGVLDFADLGEAVDDMGDFFAEVFLEYLDSGQCVLYDVVEQSTGDTNDIQFPICEDVGDLEGMHEVRLARPSDLPAMLAGGEDISTTEQIKVSIRLIAPYLLEYVFKTDHDLYV
jgi:hypothetical protein